MYVYKFPLDMHVKSERETSCAWVCVYDVWVFFFFTWQIKVIGFRFCWAYEIVVEQPSTGFKHFQNLFDLTAFLHENETDT